MENGLRINFILEIIGSPKEHVTETLGLVLDQIEDNDDIDVEVIDQGEPEPTEDDYFSVFADVDATVSDITTVGHIVNNYNPASVELIDPPVVDLDRSSFNDLFADVLAKLHMQNTQIQELKGFKETMTRKLNALARNAILLSLDDADKTEEEIAEDVGVASDDLEDMLQAMIDENRIRRRDDKYTVRV